jgi:formylglycine-generating enzyme required for sulfatase activity
MEVAHTPAPVSAKSDGEPPDAHLTKEDILPWRRREISVNLGRGVNMRLTRIPAGEFLMGGGPAGEPDEQPAARVVVARSFWIGTCEVSNEQFRRFDPAHDSRYYAKRHARSDDRGLTLDDAEQPAVRVSWHRAMAFCEWLSARTGWRFRLPTEGEWEYGCRAGSTSALAFGEVNADFSSRANLADRAFSMGLVKDGKQITGGLEHLVLEGAALADARFDDTSVVTAPIGQYRANAWGLHDLHGNAAEWTASLHRPYPYDERDGRNDPATEGRRVVRGGSFFDSPKRARSGYRSAYPPWQRVFNVGFRVACDMPEAELAVE